MKIKKVGAVRGYAILAGSYVTLFVGAIILFIARMGARFIIWPKDKDYRELMRSLRLGVKGVSMKRIKEFLEDGATWLLFKTLGALITVLAFCSWLRDGCKHPLSAYSDWS